MRRTLSTRPVAPDVHPVSQAIADGARACGAVRRIGTRQSQFRKDVVGLKKPAGERFGRLLDELIADPAVETADILGIPERVMAYVRLRRNLPATPLDVAFLDEERAQCEANPVQWEAARTRDPVALRTLRAKFVAQCETTTTAIHAIDRTLAEQDAARAATLDALQATR